MLGKEKPVFFSAMLLSMSPALRAGPMPRSSWSTQKLQGFFYSFLFIGYLFECVCVGGGRYEHELRIREESRSRESGRVRGERKCSKYTV